MTKYSDHIEALKRVKDAAGSTWDAISPESAARMRVQNQFKTALEIAQYPADIMRADEE